MTESAGATDALQAAQSYYGSVLKGTDDLKTSACCSATPRDHSVRSALKRVHPDVISRFYGCGSPIPPLLRPKTPSRANAKSSCCSIDSAGDANARDGKTTHLTVLDLGCGTGRDCFIISQLLGAQGRVLGVDATEEQLKIARRCEKWHVEKNPQSAPIDFRLGAIEDLAAAGIPDASVDIVVSNCVINLSDDKPRIFAELFRVLKPGGELFFSDVFANKRLPKSLLQNAVLHGECLAGAMFWPDMLSLMAERGCYDAREVESSPMDLFDSDLIAMLEPGTMFTSKTVRAFKSLAIKAPENCAEEEMRFAASLTEDSSTDDIVRFDSKITFQKGQAAQVIGGKLAHLLRHTRYAPFFSLRERDENDAAESVCAPSNVAEKTSCCDA